MNEFFSLLVDWLLLTAFMVCAYMLGHILDHLARMRLMRIGYSPERAQHTSALVALLIWWPAMILVQAWNSDTWRTDLFDFWFIGALIGMFPIMATGSMSQLIRRSAFEDIPERRWAYDGVAVCALATAVVEAVIGRYGLTAWLLLMTMWIVNSHWAPRRLYEEVKEIRCSTKGL